MFLFGKQATQPYRLIVTPFTYYGSSRRKLYGLLKKFFKKHKGFDAVKNQVLNKDICPASHVSITFSCTERDRQKIDALLRKQGEEPIHRSPFNGDFLVRRGFIKSCDDKNAHYERWVFAESR